MPRFQIAPTMTNPPTTSCATEPADGRVFSPLPNYFTFGDASRTQSEENSPLHLTDSGNVYLGIKGIDIDGQLAAPEAPNRANDFVPFGAQVAWDQGATPSRSAKNSTGTLSPTSQCMPAPLVPGISSFGPILTTWPMPPTKKRRPSTGEPVNDRRSNKGGKKAVKGHKETDGKSNKISTATSQPQASSDAITTTTTTPPPQDSIAVTLNIPAGEPSTSSVVQGAADDGTKVKIEHEETQDNPPTPQADPGRTQLANQRARNRVAANKFRKKSKAAVEELEAVEKVLGAQHEQLSAMARDLRAEVLELKNELLMHGNCDCDMIQQYLTNAARSLSIGAGTPAHTQRASLGYLPMLTPSAHDPLNGMQ